MSMSIKNKHRQRENDSKSDKLALDFDGEREKERRETGKRLCTAPPECLVEPGSFITPQASSRTRIGLIEV